MFICFIHYQTQTQTQFQLINHEISMKTKALCKMKFCLHMHHFRPTDFIIPNFTIPNLPQTNKRDKICTNIHKNIKILLNILIFYQHSMNKLSSCISQNFTPQKLRNCDNKLNILQNNECFLKSLPKPSKL